jgi:predicted transcriptional regulator of viral defense system
MEDAKLSLEKLTEKTGGVLTTKQFCEAGYSRMALARLVENGTLVHIRHGYYSFADQLSDEYVLLQSRSRRSIFSYGTALFFWGLSDRVPHVLDLTVPQGANVEKIRRDNPDVRFHYVAANILELGKTETLSPQGGSVVLYDKERCICDLIRTRSKTDMQLYTQAIKLYFSQGANARKLLKYGKRFGIEDKIRTYMEVLL